MKIGVSAPGSSTHMIVAHLLGKGGLKSEDVSIIGLELGLHRIGVDDGVDLALLDRRRPPPRSADTDDRHVLGFEAPLPSRWATIMWVLEPGALTRSSCP